MITCDSVVPLSIPESKVSVCHEVDIVWPDGVTERVTHLEDVTNVFRDPINRGRHEFIVAKMMMPRISTRLNFERHRPAPTPDRAEPKTSHASRGWFAKLFRR